MRWQTTPIGTVIRSSQYGLSLPVDPNGGIPIVGMKDIQDGRVRIDPEIRVNLSDEAAAPYLLKDGDVLLNRTNSPDLVGKAGIYRGAGRAVFASYLVRLELDRERVDPDFIIQILASEGGQRHIRQLATRAVSQANLNPTTFKNHFQIPLPALREQVGIRDVLMAWDAAIEKTARLIEMKDRLRRGLMQKLIMRGSFPEHTLSTFVDRVARKNATGNNHPLTISGRDGLISQSHYFDKRIAAETTEHYSRMMRGEFAYNRSYSAAYPYGAIKRLDRYDEGIVSSLYLCFAIKPDSGLLSDYLVHFCESGGFNHQIQQVAQEGARNHGLLNVAADDFFGMRLPLPSIGEQERVVGILGDASQELALLHMSLDHLRRQKRGLMQKLLTGQWRVGTTTEVPA